MRIFHRCANIIIDVYAYYDEIEQEAIAIAYQPDGRYNMRCVDGILFLHKEGNTIDVFVDTYFDEDED